jgi:hypothetical protein
MVAMGVLGFVCSALSPDDDSIQQEFSKSQNPCVQSQLKREKASSAAPLPILALSVQAFQSVFFSALDQVFYSSVNPLRAPPAHTFGDRSPPIFLVS